MARNRTRPRFYACPDYLQVWWRSYQKKEGAIVSTTFFSGAQGQVTPKSMDGCGGNLNSSEIVRLSRSPASLMKIRSKMRALMCSAHFLHYKSMGKLFGAQGQVTPKRIVWSGQKSNSSEILYLSWLPASLKRILSKVKAPSYPQHVFRRSSAGNPEVIRQIR